MSFIIEREDVKITPWIVIVLLAVQTIAAQEAPPDTIAAIVNDEVITYGKVYAQLKDSFQKIEANPNYSVGQKQVVKEDIFKNMLRDMVRKKLIEQEARRYKIKVSEEMAREQVQKKLAEYQGATPGINELDLIEFTQHQLMIRELARKKTGYSREEKLRAEIDIYVSPQEIRRIYQKHIREFTEKSKIKIRQITLYYGRSGGREQAIRTAMDIVNNLRHEQADFSLMARDNSQDPYARYGGTPLVATLLFSVPVDYAQDMENDTVKERLRQKFLENGHELSSRIKIQADPDNRRWGIEDQGNRVKYSIRQDKGALQIYQEDVWGFMEKEDLHKEVEEIAFTMKPGEVSEPIPVDHPPEGDAVAFCQIVKVEEINPGGPRDFTEVQDYIRDQLSHQKLEAAFERMIAELRRDAFIWPSDLFEE